MFGEATSGDDDFSSPDDVDELDFELSEDDELQSVADCRKMPVCVSLAKIRDCFVVDPSVEEETVHSGVLRALFTHVGAPDMWDWIKFTLAESLCLRVPAKKVRHFYNSDISTAK